MVVRSVVLHVLIHIREAISRSLGGALPRRPHPYAGLDTLQTCDNDMGVRGSEPRPSPLSHCCHARACLLILLNIDLVYLCFYYI